jgi:hypothetical protein
MTRFRRLPRSGTFGISLRYNWAWDPAEINLTGALEALGTSRPVAIGYVLPSNHAGSEGMRGRPDPNWPAHSGTGARRPSRGGSRQPACCESKQS